jgi:hypothetical protein
MPRVRGPSRRSLLAAYRLGKKMARQEPGIRPVLREVIHFSRYEDFRLAHRSTLENSRRFFLWEQRIAALAESTGRNIGFNLDKTSRVWDDFYSYVFAPLKHAFWQGWEEVRQLKDIYRKQRTMLAQGGRAVAKAADVFHVLDAAPMLPESTGDELSEEDRWDAIAEKLFDDLEGDKNEELWDLPEARSIGAKGKVAQASR